MHQHCGRDGAVIRTLRNELRIIGLCTERERGSNLATMDKEALGFELHHMLARRIASRR